MSYKHTQRWRYKARRWATLYAGDKCQCCGYNKYFGNLVFHHVDPATKINDVCKLINKTAKWYDILEEIEKCVLVCANCHGEIHAEVLNCPEINHEERSKNLLIIEKEKPVTRVHDNFCVDCNKKLFDHKSKRCMSCNGKSKEIIRWPENLPEMVANSSKLAVSKLLGISDKAVAKRLIKHHGCKNKT